jgi:hypothetical protein
VFKNDPTRVEYVRISEDDIARILEEQKRAAAAGPEGEGGPLGT